MSEGRKLVRSIGLGQAIALYVGAVVGAGVLILPGAAASMAGPASILAWTFVALLGIPLALTFAALASRYPDAGGVAAFTARAFGPDAGASAGWFYFFAAATGQIIVPLTGAYYAAPYFELSGEGTTAVAGLVLAIATAANLCGLRLSGTLQLVLSAAVAAVLALAVLAAIPRADPMNFAPFAPLGWPAVGAAGVFVFFSFCGWEAIAQLSEEFRDPARDVPRSTFCSVGIIALLYVGVSTAVVATHTYGAPDIDRIAVARLLTDATGQSAGLLAAIFALAITLGTTNTFVAGTSRLGYALARDGAFPRQMAWLDARGVPQIAVAAVGLYAGTGLLIAMLAGWGAESLLIVPNVLAIAAYVLGTAAGVRLLMGFNRVLAAVGFTLSTLLLCFAGVGLVVLPLLTLGAIAYRRRYRPRPRLSPPEAAPPPRGGP